MRLICYVLTGTTTNPLSLSDEHFWRTIQNVPSIAKENEPITIGRTTFENLADAHKQMALSCAGTSDYVNQHLIQSQFKGTVLDLGCGIGANALPLLEKGCELTIIDQQEEVILAYNSREIPLALFTAFNKGTFKQATSIVGDITIVPYPTNMDAVICVDVMPYLRPNQLKATVEKIFHALRPGGLFVGTIFFKPGQKTTDLVEAMERLRAHFYPSKIFAQEIITRSGFQIQIARERPATSWFSKSSCFEFLAENLLHYLKTLVIKQPILFLHTCLKQIEQPTLRRLIYNEKEDYQSFL